MIIIYSFFSEFSTILYYYYYLALPLLYHVVPSLIIHQYQKVFNLPIWESNPSLIYNQIEELLFIIYSLNISNRRYIKFGSDRKNNEIGDIIGKSRVVPMDPSFSWKYALRAAKRGARKRNISPKAFIKLLIGI